jgi:hypothetical protein
MHGPHENAVGQSTEAKVEGAEQLREFRRAHWELALCDGMVWRLRPYSEV